MDIIKKLAYCLGVKTPSADKTSKQTGVLKLPVKLLSIAFLVGLTGLAYATTEISIKEGETKTVSANPYNLTDTTITVEPDTSTSDTKYAVLNNSKGNISNPFRFSDTTKLEGSGKLVFKGVNGGQPISIALELNNSSTFNGEIYTLNNWGRPITTSIGSNLKETDFKNIAFGFGEEFKHYNTTSYHWNETLQIKGDVSLAGVILNEVYTTSVATVCSENTTMHTVTIAGDKTCTYAGTFGTTANPLSLVRTGSGTQTLSGATTLTNLTLTSGKLVLTGATTVSGVITLAAKETPVLTLGNTLTLGNNVTLAITTDDATTDDTTTYQLFTQSGTGALAAEKKVSCTVNGASVGYATVSTNGTVTLSTSVKGTLPSVSEGTNPKYSDIIWENGTSPSKDDAVILTLTKDTTLEMTEPLELSSLTVLGNYHLTLQFNADSIIEKEDYLTIRPFTPLKKVLLSATHDPTKVTCTIPGLLYNATGTLVQSSEEVSVNIALPLTMFDVKSISVNFTESGKTIGDTDKEGLYPVAGSNWTQTTAASGTTSIKVYDSSTDVSTSKATALTYSSNNTYRDDGFTPSLLKAYLDDGGSGVSVNVTLPEDFGPYTAIVYASTDTDNAKFTKKTVNDVAYTFANGATVSGAADWGTSINYDAISVGKNALIVTNQTTATTFKLASAKASNTVRGCVAGIQLVQEKEPNLGTNTYSASISTAGDIKWSEIQWENGASATTVSGSLPASAKCTLSLTGESQNLIFDASTTIHTLSLESEGAVSVTKSDGATITATLYDFSTVKGTLTLGVETTREAWSGTLSLAGTVVNNCDWTIGNGEALRLVQGAQMTGSGCMTYTTDSTVAVTANSESNTTTTTIAVPITASASTLTFTVPSGNTLALTGADTVKGMIKDGTGTLSLSGEKSYTGTTTISAGTLLLKDVTSFGEGAISIASGTTLSVNSSALTLAGVISGAGNLKVLGGTLTLTGANTATGSLTLVENSGETLILTNTNSWYGTAYRDFTIPKGVTLDVSDANAKLCPVGTNVYCNGVMTVKGTLKTRNWDYGVSLGNFRTNSEAMMVDGGTVVFTESMNCDRGFKTTSNGGTFIISEGLTFEKNANNDNGTLNFAGNLALTGSGTYKFTDTRAEKGNGVVKVAKGTTLAGTQTLANVEFVDGAILDASASTATSALTATSLTLPKTGSVKVKLAQAPAARTYLIKCGGKPAPSDALKFACTGTTLCVAPAKTGTTGYQLVTPPVAPSLPENIKLPPKDQAALKKEIQEVAAANGITEEATVKFTGKTSASEKPVSDDALTAMLGCFDGGTLTADAENSTVSIVYDFGISAITIKPVTVNDVTANYIVVTAEVAGEATILPSAIVSITVQHDGKSTEFTMEEVTDETATKTGPPTEAKSTRYFRLPYSDIQSKTGTYQFTVKAATAATDTTTEEE